MRLDRLHLVRSIPGYVPVHSYFPRRLPLIGWVSLLMVGTLGNAAADDPLNTPGAVSSPPVTDNSPPPASTPDNSGATITPQAVVNQPNTPQSPDSTQTTVTGPPQNTPLLPFQGGNAYSPFSPYATGYQSSDVTAPALYNTGGTDLSQVGTNTALSQAFGNESSAGFLSQADVGYSYPPIQRIQLGPIDLKAAAVASIVSDDNLRFGNNTANGSQSKEHDVSYSVTPAVLFEYGNHEGQKGYASLIYAPTITRFLHYSAQNSDDQNVSLSLRYPFQRLALDANETYTQTTGYNTDIDARTTETANLAAFGGTYDYDDKLSFASHVQNAITTYNQPGGNSQNGSNSGTGFGQGDNTTSLNNSAIYHLSEKMSLIGSGNIGVDKPNREKQQTFEQALLGINYQPTEKISLAAQGGAEFRQGVENNLDGINNGNNQSRDVTNPIFSAQIGYIPFDSTAISITASQGVRTSADSAQQTVVDSAVGASITQRFFQRFFLNFTLGYTHTKDEDSGGNNTTDTTANEVQDVLSYRTSLSVAPTAWSSVAIYYQYLDNQSNIATDTYHDNQVGLSVSAQF
jgi:Putative beta-barrel porin 2